MYLSLILFDTFGVIHSIIKESKYTAVFLSINNETQCVPLLCLSSIYMTYAPSFILGKLSLEKMAINLVLLLECLVLSILLKGWSRTKTFYPYDPYYYIFLLS